MSRREIAWRNLKPFVLLVMFTLGLLFIVISICSAFTPVHRSEEELLWSETLQVGPNATETIPHNFSFLVESGRNPSLAVEFNTSINLQEEYLEAGTSIFSETHYDLTWMGFQASVVGIWHISADTTKAVQMIITQTKVWTEITFLWTLTNTVVFLVGLLLIGLFSVLLFSKHGASNHVS